MAIPTIHLPNLLLLLILLSFLLVCQTTPINLTASLFATDESSPWKSPSGEFAIGFRRLEDQEQFLLAIWFESIPDRTIVWYADGNTSVPKESKAELTSTGLTVSDAKGQVIWQSQSAVDRNNIGPIAGVAYAEMRDTGNFVLLDKDSNSLWESFKYPTDTLLPTQELEIGDKLSSRLTATTYSKGRFQLLLQPDGNLVLNTTALPTEFRYGAYYSSNTSGVAGSMSAGKTLRFDKGGQLSIIRKNGNISDLSEQYNNDSSGGLYYYRATLDFVGVFRLYAHPKARDGSRQVQSWLTFWFEPKNICTNMTADLRSGPCGFNSYYIAESDGRSSCKCVPGFYRTDQFDKFNDCIQERVQKCEPGGLKSDDVYEMEVLNNTYWPSSPFFEKLKPSNETACRSSCLSDCNCVVAVVNEGTCYKKKLPLSNGRVDRSVDAKAFIKLAKSGGDDYDPRSGGNSDKQKKDQSTLILVVSLLLGSSAFLNILFIISILLLLFRSNNKQGKISRVPSILETNIRSFTYDDLKKATDGFREELGRGAFGTVFKGVLLLPSQNSRLLVAVKKLDKVVQEGEKEFKAEVRAIAQTHHKNLVRLLGFCDEGPHKLLVYEFMSNGTLATFLFGISRPDWNKRFQMASGIARGLMYLHEECSTQIIHCDIKPQNILLDDSHTARISDFGLAKLLMSGQTRTQTAIRGTKGYVAPEWFRNTPVTTKVDVFSYGVMLLEIICCRKSIEQERENEEEAILTDWAYDCYKEGRLDKLVENDEEAINDMRKVEKLVMVGIWCIQEDPSLRPSMRMVTQMLEGVLSVSSPPCPSLLSSKC